MRDPVLLALVLTFSAGSAAFMSPEQVAVATRTSQSPVIDGNLADPVWVQAVPITDFTQQTPDEGETPSQKTEVRILYDDQAIYFGIRCFDTDPKTIVANMTRRDRDSCQPLRYGHRRRERSAVGRAGPPGAAQRCCCCRQRQHG